MDVVGLNGSEFVGWTENLEGVPMNKVVQSSSEFTGLETEGTGAEGKGSAGFELTERSKRSPVRRSICPC